MYGPCNEEDFALPAVVNGDKVEIKDGVSAVVVGQRLGHVVVALAGAADLVDRYELRLLVDLEHYVPMYLLPFHLHERVLALICHPHSGRGLSCLETYHSHKL